MEVKDTISKSCPGNLQVKVTKGNQGFLIFRSPEVMRHLMQVKDTISKSCQVI